MKIFSKKADLSLSINSIVILILAITMLGLGLAFMNNLFGGTTKKFQKITESIDEQQIENIKNELETKRIVLKPSQITIKKGESTYTLLGIKNDVDLSGDDTFDINYLGCTSVQKNSCDFGPKPSTFSELPLPQGQSDVIAITIDAGSSVPSDIYRYQYQIVSQVDPKKYSETVTLTVKVGI